MMMFENVEAGILLYPFEMNERSPPVLWPS